MERTRHGTGSSVHQSTMQPIYTEQDLDSDDSFSSTGRRGKSGSQSSGNGGGRPGYGTDLDGAQDGDEMRATFGRSDSNSDGERSDKLGHRGKAHSTTSEEEIVTYRRMYQHETPEKERVLLDVIHPVDLPSGLSDLPSGDSLFPSSSAGDPTDSSRDQMNREMQYQRYVVFNCWR